MKYQTRDFGEIEIEQERVISFVQPILVYERLTDYTLLYDKETGPGLVWLQSLEEKDVCFILLDPTALPMEYAPFVSEEEAQALGEGELLYLPIVYIPENLKRSTVNLRSPIVVNPATRKAMQIILPREFPTRVPLFEEEEEC